MVAAEGERVETVVALIKHGADVNLKGPVSCWSQFAINVPLAYLVYNSMEGLPLWWLLEVDMLRL